MDMKGERALPAGRDRAWQALNDPEALKGAIPGCESITANASGGYDVLINAVVGPVRARFKGTMTLADVAAPRSYTLRFEGQGGPAGFARGEARVSLEEQTAMQSLLRYEVSAQVGGKLAQVGSRLIDAAAGAMADQFFTAFASQLANGPAPATAGPARIGLWSMLRAMLARLFGRRD
jgi:carbon monoxide dehydrogenase subunit G